MKFVIEEVLEVKPDDNGKRVELRARLEDGRLSCITTTKSTDAAYEVAVAEYLERHVPKDEQEGS
jgi:hypothetical protein